MGMIWEKFGLDVLFHVLMLPFGWLPESIVFCWASFFASLDLFWLVVC